MVNMPRQFTKTTTTCTMKNIPEIISWLQSLSSTSSVGLGPEGWLVQVMPGGTFGSTLDVGGLPKQFVPSESKFEMDYDKKPELKPGCTAHFESGAKGEYFKATVAALEFYPEEFVRITSTTGQVYYSLLGDINVLEEETTPQAA